jgi:hypothetical protein
MYLLTAYMSRSLTIFDENSQIAVGAVNNIFVCALISVTRVQHEEVNRRMTRDAAINERSYYRSLFYRVHPVALYIITLFKICLQTQHVVKNKVIRVI